MSRIMKVSIPVLSLNCMFLCLFRFKQWPVETNLKTELYQIKKKEMTDCYLDTVQH